MTVNSKKKNPCVPASRSSSPLNSHCPVPNAGENHNVSALAQSSNTLLAGWLDGWLDGPFVEQHMRENEKALLCQPKKDFLVHVSSSGGQLPRVRTPP